MTERDIFLAATTSTSRRQRAAYIDKACCGNPALREKVEALLHSPRSAGSFLAKPAVAAGNAGPAQPGCAVSRRRDGVAGMRANARRRGGHSLSWPRRTRPDSLGRLGHYEVLQVLGQGGFGIVFRAFDEVLQRVVAMKVLAPQLAATSPARKRFLREARSSAQVRHENVVHVYEVEEQPLPYLVDGVHSRRDAATAARPHRPARRAGGVADRPADRRGAGGGPCDRPDPPRHQAGQHPARRRAAAR